MAGVQEDITNRADIEKVLVIFYSQAMKDDLIGRFFTEVVSLHLPTHIPLIASFWESVLFYTQGYRKNVMDIHQHISNLSPIKKLHLDRWLLLFIRVIDGLFTGDKANLMKQRATSIATMMNIKLNHGPIQTI
ncbi:MAG: group III truncated hemoglobin [Chitinophagaceae bacterium]